MVMRRARSAGLVILILSLGWSCAPAALRTTAKPESPAGLTSGVPNETPAPPLGPRVEILEGRLGEVLTVACVDPLQKVFRESSFLPEDRAVADVARGEYATFQFVLRSDRNIRSLAAKVGSIISGQASLANA